MEFGLPAQRYSR